MVSGAPGRHGVRCRSFGRCRNGMCARDKPAGRGDRRGQPGGHRLSPGRLDLPADEPRYAAPRAALRRRAVGETHRQPRLAPSRTHRFRHRAVGCSCSRHDRPGTVRGGMVPICACCSPGMTTCSHSSRTRDRGSARWRICAANASASDALDRGSESAWSAS